MGHYNSTHAVLEEEKHVFEMALLQVRNVKQSAYFRWQWEPELFLANPTQLTSNEGKRNLCSKVFAVSCVRHLSILMKRPLTACVLQRAALKSPIVTTERKFSRFAFRTYFPAAAFALPQTTQWAIAGSASFQRASQAHKTTAPLKPQAETVQLKWDGITTIPQSYADCGLIHFAASPNNSPQKRAKSHCLNNLIYNSFGSSTPNNPFLHLDARVCLREKDCGSHYICALSVLMLPTADHLACWSQKTEGKPSKVK